MERFYEIYAEAGAKEVFNIIEKGFLIIDNERLKRACPDALMPVGFRWK